MTQDDIVLMDRVLTNSINLYRFTASERSKVIALLKRMAIDLRAQIAEREGDTFTKARLRTLLKQSEAVINDYYVAIGQGLNDQLEKLAVIEANKTATIYKGTELAVNLPTINTLKSIVSDSLVVGTPTSEWWGRQASGLIFQYSAQLRLGIAAGETNAQIQRRVMPLLEVSKRNAATLVHDSVMTVANNARMAFFKENEEIYKGYRQISTLDTKTSEICIAYSGAEWDLNLEPLKGAPAYNGGCPRHPNCRSVIIAITKTFRELGLNIDEIPKTTRASDEGQISASTTFDQFLNRKTIEQQNEMLGKGKAQLWRNGKITLRDLLDQSGRPLTLEELKNL
jgi:hypothetical protein